MIAFVAISLLVTMSLGQLEPFGQRSLQYWLVVISGILFPLVDLPAILETLFGRAKLLLVFLLSAGVWHLSLGDVRATVQLCAFIVALAWVSSDRASVTVRDLTRLYLLLLVVGLSVSLFSDLNRYGLIPGFSEPSYGVWRISFFPNVAYSGILSLVMLLVLTSSRERAKAHPFVLTIAVYFLAFSAVRAALIAAGIYIILFSLFCRSKRLRPARLFWMALLIALGINVGVWFSAEILYALQRNTLVSTLLLRGASDMSIDEILYQLYRPWLWKAHLQLFISSPSLMGWGSPDSYQPMIDAASPPFATTGSESLPTRLLASYGVAGMLFLVYLAQQLRRIAIRDDRWACACFPPVCILMMNWGGVFHPTDGLFVLLLLPIMQGSNGFIDELSSPENLAELRANEA